jgi:hypothetical protein
MERRPRSRHAAAAPIATLGLMVYLLAGCGEDSPTSPPPATPADVDSYMATLPSWNTFAGVQPDFEEPVGNPADTTITGANGDYQCSVTTYDMLRTPDKMVLFNPDSEVLWLGALIQGRGYKDGLGSLKELPIRQRAPLEVSIDLLTENNTRTVENPALNSVNQAIGGLIEAATLAGHRAGTTFSYDQTSSHSLEQSSLQLGIAVRFLGSEVTSSLSVDRTVERNTLTAYFLQRMFTTSMVLPQTPAEVFSDDFTAQRLQEQIDAENIGPENPPVFVSSITWGRMLMVTMTSTYSVSEMVAALNATRSSLGGGSVEGHDLEVLQESEFRARGVGGDAQGVDAMLQEGRLAEYFDTESDLTTARPIAYTLRNLANNDAAMVSEMTRYNVMECAPVLGEVTGGRYRVTLLRLYLVADGCDGAFNPSPEVYFDFDYDAGAGFQAFAARSSGNAATLAQGSSLPINVAREVDLHYDQRERLRILGYAWDYDTDSAAEQMGSWDLTYYAPVSNGTRYFTRSGGGCSIRLYLDIQRIGDLYD